MTNGYLDGAGTFATNAANGAQFIEVTIEPSVGVMSNSAKDQFIHVTNSAALTVSAGVNATGASTTVNLNGFTNQGLGSITIGAGSQINVNNFQSYGMMTLTPATGSQRTLLTNQGSSPLGFNGGSQTFIGTPATAGSTGNPSFVAGIDLHGQNAIVAGGLFVNNGFVADSSPAGTATVIADFGALVKGAGFFQNPVITQNGGKFQAGNSPGSAAFGNFVFGPGGVNSYVFAIDDAAGSAGPHPNAAGRVSGWSLVSAVRQQMGSITTTGNFTWTADPADKLTLALDTLINPTIVGTDVAGPMADFDPSQAYFWPAVRWTGTYSGPTDALALDAATSFDTTGFENPIIGTFGWSLDAADQTLSLTYTPTPVPEPGTLALTGIAAIGWVTFWRRRWQSNAPRLLRPHDPSPAHIGRTLPCGAFGTVRGTWLAESSRWPGRCWTSQGWQGGRAAEGWAVGEALRERAITGRPVAFGGVNSRVLADSDFLGPRWKGFSAPESICVTARWADPRTTANSNDN